MRKLLILSALLIILPTSLVAQTYAVQRTITKTDRFDFYSGGTVAITGAPNGSIVVEGSTSNEIEITAEIRLQAANEVELDFLASNTGFITDESAVRAAIITIGNHNKFGQKKLPKNVGKNLMLLPYTVNYVIRVPRYSEIEIDGGSGDLTIRGIEGSIRANFLDSNAKVEIIGGTSSVAIGKGTADVYFSPKGWRGRAANIQVAQGDLTVWLPTMLSAEIDASVIGAGSIVNLFPDL